MVNTFKKLNATIVLALMCFVFTSTPLYAASIAQAREALALFEADGDIENAALVREAIRKATASFTPTAEDIEREMQLSRRRATLVERPPKDPGFFDEAAYFLGFGKKAAAERRSEQANQCATSAAEYYREKRYEAAVNPSTWQLDGYESAEDYAGAFRSSFYRRCASR